MVVVVANRGLEHPMHIQGGIVRGLAVTWGAADLVIVLEEKHSVHSRAVSLPSGVRVRGQDSG